MGKRSSKKLYSCFLNIKHDSALDKLRYFVKLYDYNKILNTVDKKNLYYFNVSKINKYYYKFCLDNFFLKASLFKLLNKLPYAGILRDSGFIANFANKNRILTRLSVFSKILNKNTFNKNKKYLEINPLINLYLFTSRNFANFANAGLYKKYIYNTTYTPKWDLYSDVDLLKEYGLDFETEPVDVKNQLIGIYFSIFRVILDERNFIDGSGVASIDELSLDEESPSIKEFAETFGYDGISLIKPQFTKIQFKPGYQTFFRDLRRNYMWVNNLKFNYQWKLTRYLTKFRSMNDFELIRSNTFALRDLLVKMHFSATTSQAEFLIESGRVYLNGISVNNPKQFLQYSDFIQIEVSYIAYNEIHRQLLGRLEFLNYSYDLYTKFNYEYKKYSVSDFTEFTEQCRPFGIFKSLKVSNMLKLYYSIFDIPQYVEVDYLTLSAVVINDMLDSSMFDYINLRRVAIGYIKMLNWKYLS